MTKDNADYGLYVHYVRSAIPKCHGYQELHAHSEASFRDAVNKVDDFVETAKGYGRQAFEKLCKTLRRNHILSIIGTNKNTATSYEIAVYRF